MVEIHPLLSMYKDWKREQDIQTYIHKYEWTEGQMDGVAYTEYYMSALWAGDIKILKINELFDSAYQVSG